MTNAACNAFIPQGEGGVCYKEGVVQKTNYQICDITNRKILDQLNPKKPQATFSCNAEDQECTFQCKCYIPAEPYMTNSKIVWVDEIESFYCALDTCTWDFEAEENRNTTSYTCENIKCQCVPDRMLCGEAGSIDISDFLTEEIKGPASFITVSTEGGSWKDGSKFSEPAMNDLISSVFGDLSITLNCNAGECLYQTDVPGYEKPIKKINTPLIAGVIASCALFVVAVILLFWYLSRRSSQRYGPIHLSEEDEDQNAKLMADHKPAALHFDNVSYRLNGKQILSGVMGAVHPGELMAIMGASGAGKTTFLDILARKNKKGSSTGEFYVNGEKIIDEEFRSVIGFVDQDDTMLPTLTVHETIVDSALLRLPKDMTRAAKLQRVEDVERQLGIYQIRDQIIGSEEGSGRGISGGEKRRVGIACELVTSPSILFLDEPTSGLDAFNAYNVVECLVNLVKTYNRTVIFTIHQPRSNIVALFDQLVLLAKGRTVYSGRFSQCQAYFDSIGYTCPPGFNIADYLVDLTMHAGLARSPMDDVLESQNGGGYTRSSSIMAIKSVGSASNMAASFGNAESTASEPATRPIGKRTTSVRQQQDHQLFTRKQSQKSGMEAPATPTTLRSEEEANILGNPREASQAWLRLSKQSGGKPSSLSGTNDAGSSESSIAGTDLDTLISSYASSHVAASIRDSIRETISSAASSDGPSTDQRQVNGNLSPTTNQNTATDPDHRTASAATSGRVKSYRRIGLFSQFCILSLRTWRNLYRDPMLMLTHYAISIVLAVFLGFLFYGLTDDIAGFQNRLGLFFFILALFGFSTLTSLTVFGNERLLFVRERAKGYYSPLSYFVAKVIFDVVPLRLIPPIILGTVVYPMTGLVPAWPEFFKFILFLVLFNLAAATICLFIGIVFRNGGLANLIGSLVMLFSLLMSGFLLNHETIPKAAIWLQSVRPFLPSLPSQPPILSFPKLPKTSPNSTH